MSYIACIRFLSRATEEMAAVNGDKAMGKVNRAREAEKIALTAVWSIEARGSVIECDRFDGDKARICACVDALMR